MSANRKNRDQNDKPRGRGVLWFIAGIIVALIIVFAFPAIHDAVTHVGNTTAEQAKSLQDKLARAPATASSESDTEPAFDFYSLLTHPTQILTSSETDEVKGQPGSRTPVKKPGKYILQVASVKKRQSAQRLKAQLALWGIIAHVQTVDIQGDTWHRIRVGPVDKLARLNELRAKLDEHNLKPLLIRVNQ